MNRICIYILSKYVKQSFVELFDSSFYIGKSLSSSSFLSSFSRRPLIAFSISIAFLLMSTGEKANAATYYARTSGTWTPGTPTAAIFAITSCATALTSENPLVTDNIIICSGVTLTLGGGQVQTTGSITIDDGGVFALGANNFTVGSGGLTMTCAGVTGSSITGTGTLTLPAAVTVSSGAGTLGATISCPVAFGANCTLTVASGSTPADLSISGVLSGAFSLTKAGAGLMNLSGTNTYTKATTVSAGTLQLGNTAALGTSSGVSVTAGATLDLAGFTLGTAPAITLNGTGITSGGALMNSGAAATYSGLLTLGSSCSIIGGTGSITLSAAGNITGNTFNLTLGGAQGGTVAGKIKTTSGNVTKQDAGTWTLSGANTFTGGVNLNAGQININATAALGTGTLTIASGTTIDNTSGAAKLPTNAVNCGGAFTFVGSNALTFSTGAVTMLANTPITVSSNTLTFTGVISDGGNGYQIEQLGTTGTITLSTSTNTYTGGYWLHQGFLNIDNGGALGTTGSGLGMFIIDNGTTFDNIAAGTLTVTPTALPQTWNGSFTFTGTSSLYFSGNILMTQSLTLTSSGTAGKVHSEAGVISDGGNGYTLTKAGPGELLLWGNNTFTGGINHTAGILDINNAGALGAIGPGSGMFTISSGGTIDNTSGAAIGTSTNNNPQTWAGSFQFNGTGSLNMGTGAVTMNSTLSITAAASTFTVGGAIGGTFGLTKLGAGTLCLSGNSTFSGGLSHNLGKLFIDNDGALGTGTFTLAVAGVTIDNTSGMVITCTNNNVQAWNANFTFTGSNSLNMGTGAVTLGANTTITNSASTFTVGGPIGDGGNGYSLTMGGTGTLCLSGNNGFTGGITLSAAGTLDIDNNGALGAVGPGTGLFTISAAATIDNTTALPVIISSSIPQSWASNYTFGGSNPLNMGIGNVAINSTNLTITQNGSILTEGGTIANGSKNNLAITGVATSTLILAGNSSYSGTTKVNSGTLQLGSTTALGTSSGVTVTAGAVLDVNGITLSSGIPISSLNGRGITGVGGGALINSSATAASYTGAITLGSTSSIVSPAGTFTIGAVSGHFTLVLGGTAIGSNVSGVIGTGAVLVTKIGTGTWNLSGTNSYTGATVDSAGILQLGSTTALGTTSSATVISGAAIDVNGFTLTTARPLTLNGTGISSGGALTNSSATASTYKGAVTLGSASSIVSPSGTFTVSGNISTAGFGLTLDGTATGSSVSGIISGALGTVTKIGTGTWTLSGLNTYTGATNVNAGTLAAGHITSAFGITSAVVMANTAGAILNTTGFNNTIGSLTGGGTAGGNVTLGTAILTIGSDNTSPATYAGIVSDAGGGQITKTGTGTLNLSGSNTYTGLTTVSGGTLQLGAAGGATNTPLGTTAAGTSVTSGATLDLAGFTLGTAEALTLNGTGIGSGGALMNSGAAAATYSGLVTLGSASSIIGGSGTIALTNVGTITGATFGLTLGGAQGGSVSSIIGTTSGTVTKQDAGTWTLSGVNTFTGGTTLSAGQLNINNAAALGTGAFTIDAGTTIDNTSGAAIITSAHNNTQTWNGNFTFNGSNSLNMGTGAVTMSGSTQVTCTANTFTVGGVINSAANNLTIAGGTGTFSFGSGSQAITLNSLTINSGTTLVSTSGTLNLAGNFSNSGTFTHNTGTVTFNGIAAQSIGGSTPSTFYNLMADNTAGSGAGANVITLSDPTTVSNQLTLTAGIVSTTTSNILSITNTSTAATNIGNDISFVNGPISWSVTAGSYLFPTGAGTTTASAVSPSSYLPIGINITAGGPTTFTCQYFNSVPPNIGALASGTPSLVTVCGLRYWTAEPASAVTAAVTLYWNNASFSGINNCADLVVAHYNSSNQWEDVGQASTTGSCVLEWGGTITGNSMTDFSPFTFGSTTGGGQDPLPIGLLYFNAVYNGETVNLSWATATESNNDYFTIERSLDGVNYTVVGTVPSQAINGNSISELIYNFNDPNTASGIYYYRLKQTDLDGSYTYSGVQEATIGGNLNFSFEMAPNPNNGRQMTVFISDPISDQIVTMTIRNVLGQTVFTQNFTTTRENSTSSFPVYFQELLSAGVYTVTVTADNQPALSKRLVVN